MKINKNLFLKNPNLNFKKSHILLKKINNKLI